MYIYSQTYTRFVYIKPGTGSLDLAGLGDFSLCLRSPAVGFDFSGLADFSGLCLRSPAAGLDFTGLADFSGLCSRSPAGLDFTGLADFSGLRPRAGLDFTGLTARVFLADSASESSVSKFAGTVEAVLDRRT